MIRRLAISLVAALACCGCYDRFGTPDGSAEPLAPTWTIAELRSYCFGRPFVVDSDAVVSGVVTSNDREGNFYRTFTIADSSGGAEIMAGITDLHNIWPEGCRVSVRLKGCAVDLESGVLRIGLPAEEYDYYSVDYFYSKVELDRRIVRDGMAGAADIPVVAIAELDGRLCGCPVTVEGVAAVAVGEECTWSGYVRFEDGAGRAVYTNTSAYAAFADEALPEGEVSITGILQYGSVSREEGENFILKMRSREDCSAHN